MSIYFICCLALALTTSIKPLEAGYGREYGSFTQWSPWSTCSVTCGNGQEVRTRQCTYAGQCEGAKTELKDCGGPQCATWQNWGFWSPCSTTCGYGTHRRSRTCGVYGGFCAGDANEYQDCNGPPCCTDWSEWSVCSQSCGSGVQRRSQQCGTTARAKRQRTYVDQNPTKTIREESTKCNTFSCAEWDSWNGWSACSLSCGSDGVRSRYRSCHADDYACRQNTYSQSPGQSPYSVAKQIVTTTRNPFNPNNPEFLDRMFGSNSINKRNKREDNPACSCKGESTTNENCNNFKCPQWSSWSSWTPCSQSCSAQNGSAGVRTKSRTCVTDSAYCNAGNSRPTVNVNVDVNVTVNGGNGASVHKTLHSNNPNTHLTVNTDSNRRLRRQYNSACSCGSESTASETCNDFICAYYGEWGEWSSCSSSCGIGGTRSRTRSCTTDPRYCVGDRMTSDSICKCTGTVPSVTVSCNTFTCPVWGDWSGWNQCSVSCGTGGTHTKTRNCQVDKIQCTNSGTSGTTGDRPNVNVDVDVNVNVNNGDKRRLKDNRWKTASEKRLNSDESLNGPPVKSSRSKRTLRRNTRRRLAVKLNKSFRRLIRQTNDPCNCEGSGSISEPCNNVKCPTFSDWSGWSTCSSSCGGGSRTQTRNCLIDANFCKGTSANQTLCQCSGVRSQSDSCNNDPCPTYSAWSTWSTCSVTCGANGTISRSRTCSRSDVQCAGPSSDTKSCSAGQCYSWQPWESWSGDCQFILCGGGSVNRTRKCPVEGACPGLSAESSICNQQPCPDWGQWAEWSGCSATCAGGSRVRTRSCPSASTCKPGNPYEVDPVKCNTQACPAWTEWTPWSTCSASCGVGNRRRNRTCPINDGCPGRTEDVDPCSATPCPPVIPLSPWSECSKTCGGGLKTRSKTSCAEGPPTCPVDSETSPCNEQICPLWESWGPWSDCSKTCGSGQRTRSRGCAIVNGCIGVGHMIDPLPCNSLGCPTTRKRV